MRAYLTIVAIFCLLAGSFTLTASAQLVEKYTLENPNPNSRWFGNAVAGLGDVNGDGFPDFAVGTGLSPNDPGHVNVYSGQGGFQLYELVGDQNNQGFGSQIANAGDVNNDGVADLIVGSEGYDSGGLNNVGRVQVFSGVDGSQIHSIVGTLANGKLGVAVCGHGDINNDGHADFACSAHNAPSLAGTSGVLTYSGIDGAVIHSRVGIEVNSRASISNAGRINNDTTNDLLIGWPNAVGFLGIIGVYSGTNGNIIRGHNGEPGAQGYGRLGTSCAGVGDINNDGRDDYAVGEPRYDPNFILDAGRVRIFSGTNGSTLLTLDGTNSGMQLGLTMNPIGDMDADGIPDLLVGSGLADENGTNSGRAWVYSLATGNIIHALDGSAGTRFGTSVASIGDVNQDGAEDFIVGATHTTGLDSESGSAHVYLGTQTRTSPPLRFDGSAANDEFGREVEMAGDVDGDGHGDFIVAAQLHDTNANDAGQVRVYSGKHGGLIHVFYGDENGSLFGARVDGAGDVNNDGFADVIIGTPRKNGSGASSGQVRVYSGLDASVLYTFDGQGPFGQLGRGVAGAGDVNNDGFDDVIVGAPFIDAMGMTNNGEARVYSGIDGSLLHTFNGAGNQDQFGRDLNGAGDVNGDGFDDVVIGARLVNNAGLVDSGAAYVYSGVDGSLLHTFFGTDDGGLLGKSVAGAGDMNGDGYDDIVVGAPQAQSMSGESGRAIVFSGFDGSILQSFWGQANSLFGDSVGAGGDVNGDGVIDIVVGAPTDSFNGQAFGSVSLYSGATGTKLAVYCGEDADDEFGFSVSQLRDLNNDGLADLIVGARFADFNGTDSGSAYYFESEPLLNTFPYFESFDSLASNMGGPSPLATDLPARWVNSKKDAFGATGSDDWYPNSGMPGSGNGPMDDHTLGGGTQGVYLHIDDSGDDAATIDLLSPPFDFTNVIHPKLVFWHFGFNRDASPLTTQNFLIVDVVSTGGDLIANALPSVGHVSVDGWVKREIDLLAFAGQEVRIRFRADNTNMSSGSGGHDIAIDDFLIFDADVNKGQSPVPGLAEFDINDSLLDLVAFAGLPGATTAFATPGGPLTLSFAGSPNQGVACLFGPHNPAHTDFGPTGLIDIGLPDSNSDGIPEALVVLGDGIAPAGLNDLFFNTGPAGLGTITYTMPSTFLPGLLTTFQSLFATPLGLRFGNAVSLVVQ